MNRRDTIILAVLINVSLLVILFATARNSDVGVIGSQPEPIPQLVEMQKDAPRQGEVISLVPGDEIDKMLSQAATARATTKSPEKLVTAVMEFPLGNSATISKADADDGKYVDVTVKTGDYLERIARMNGTTIEDIISTNDLKNSLLQVGQVLKIPVISPVDPVVHRSNNVESNSQYYTVKSGDNPWLIAIRHRVPLEELLRLNSLDEDKARQLKPGDRLRVR